MFNLGIDALGVAIHHTSIRMICKDWEIRVEDEVIGMKIT